MKVLPLPVAVAILVSSAAAHAQVGGAVTASFSDLTVSIVSASGSAKSVSGFAPGWVAGHSNRPSEVDYSQDVYVGELLPTSPGRVLPVEGTVSTDRGLSTVSVSGNGITTRLSNQSLEWSGLYTGTPFSHGTEFSEAVLADGSVTKIQRDHWYQWNYTSKGALVGSVDFGEEGFITGVPVTLQPGETLSVTANFSVAASMSTSDIQSQLELLRDQVGDKEGRSFTADAYLSAQLAVGSSYDLPVSVSSPLCDGTNPSVMCDSYFSGSVMMGMVLKSDGTWAMALDRDESISGQNAFTAPVRFTFFNNTEEAQEVNVGGSMSVQMGMMAGYSDQWTTDTVLPLTPAPAVPEPSTWGLVALGLAGLAAHKRQRALRKN